VFPKQSALQKHNFLKKLKLPLSKFGKRAPDHHALWSVFNSWYYTKKIQPAWQTKYFDSSDKADAKHVPWYHAQISGSPRARFWMVDCFLHVTFANSIVPCDNEVVEFRSTYLERNKRPTLWMWDIFISPIIIPSIKTQ